jgi:2-polyprenyl-6-methoxyphenol hydroxylase-like FAD-dependent oxidoreductase
MKSERSIVVAGGSLAGLMTGIEMAAAGCDVHIYERCERVLDDRGAGIVMQAETRHFLVDRCGLSERETGVWLHYRQYLNVSGTPDMHQRMPQLMTSWGLIYRALRKAFPNDRYHEGIALNGFSQNNGRVTARFDGIDEQNVDLLVGADGSRSFVRQQLMPEIKPRYAGYVAWRGVMPEQSAGKTLLTTFADHFTFQQMRHSHILCYLIPGAEGETEPGKRRLNWVWYWNVPEPELADLMTGRDGKFRDFSVPPGQVSQEKLNGQGQIAREVFCPQFLDLWEATTGPFVQPILDLSVPKMVHGRVAILGDAAFIPRPHTAASTSKAGHNAIALGNAALMHPNDLNAALEAWEPHQLAYGQYLERHGMALGNRSQFS